MLEKLLKQADGSYLDESGCTWDSQSDYMMMHVLPSCGCGDPQSIGRYVLDMIKNHVACGGYTIAKEPAEYEDLPTMFFLNWLDREGYVDHGCTIRLPWLSPMGEELIRDLETVLAQEAGDE